MEDGATGPSTVKNPKLTKRTPFKFCMYEEMLEQLLYDSDCDYELPIFNDEDAGSGSEESEREDPIDNESWDSCSPTPPQSPSPSAIVTDDPLQVNIPWDETPALTNLNFEKNGQLLVEHPGTNPIDFYNLLVTDEFYNLVLGQTNKYAVEVFLENCEWKHPEITKWKPITKEELKIFFGLFLHMGRIRLFKLQDYWSTDTWYNLSIFSKFMSRDRFMLILRCLHFVDNAKICKPASPDRLFKVRPLINYFNSKMVEIYYPEKNLSIDEPMVFWGGRLVFSREVRNKCNKYGVKLYTLTEPEGIILKLIADTGVLEQKRCEGLAANVVLNLMSEKLDVGHCLYLDYCYNSYQLSRQLLARKTHSTGILYLDKNNWPPAVKNCKLKKEENSCRYANGVMVGKWRYSGGIVYISTEFENRMHSYINKRKKEKKIPLPVFHYDKNMVEMDREEQLTECYSCGRVKISWYKKIGLHILQLLFLNSYLLYKKYQSPKSSFYDFRLAVVSTLLPEDFVKPVETKT